MSTLSIADYFPFRRVKILSQAVHGEDASSALIQVGPDLRYHPICHACGTPAATIHSQSHRRFIRDLNLAQAEVFLQVAYRKIWCPACHGVRVEGLEFVNASARVTHRLAQYIHGLCKLMTVADVAEHLNLDPKTVKDIDKAFLEDQFNDCDFVRGLEILMIDEIAIRKGHRYMTVVADYVTGRVIWMGQDRNRKTLDQFFRCLNPTQRRSIQAVALDMWEPFINRVNHYCPQAKIVFDFFHVVQGFGRVIDQVRRSEYARAKGQNRQVIKGSRYLLLKNEENLSDDQRIRLQDLLEVNRTLSQVYLLKDQLKLLFVYDQRKKVRKALDDWCHMARHVNHPAVRKFADQLEYFAYGILNHADYPIGTSKLEGINNKIKVLKRKAYGFHDDRYFILKVKQACVA